MIQSLKLVACTLCAALAATAIAGPPVGAPTGAAPVGPDYRIGPGDSLQIYFW